MKILINGPEQLSKVNCQIDCYNCKSKLEVTPADAARKSFDRDGSAYVFNCPVCHKDIYVDMKVFGV
jgi:hypothetical protein